MCCHNGFHWLHDNRLFQAAVAELRPPSYTEIEQKWGFSAALHGYFPAFGKDTVEYQHLHTILEVVCTKGALRWFLLQAYPPLLAVMVDFPVKPFGYRRQHAVEVVAFEIGFHSYWVLISHGGKPLFRAGLLQAGKAEKAFAAAKERQCSSVLELSIID